MVLNFQQFCLQIRYFTLNIIIMTQNQLKILALLSLSATCLAIFNLTTIICLLCAIFFIYSYLKVLLLRYVSHGLISVLPLSVQDHLLHKSIFDIVCDFWFYDSFVFLKRFFKLLFKPLFQPVKPESAIATLDDMQPKMKKMILEKGVVRVLPSFCQRIILGKEQLQIESERWQREQEEKRRVFIKKCDSEEQRNDRPAENKRLIRRSSSLNIKIPLSDGKQNDVNHVDASQDSYALSSQQKTVKKVVVPRKKGHNILQNVYNTIQMVKHVLEVSNINGTIHKVKMTTIVKIMILFWAVLLCQWKFNNRAKATIIKTLMILMGIITVFGTVGTTGVFVLKCIKKRRNSEIQNQICADSDIQP